MKKSKVKWHGQDNYNMNCDIEELEKLGFVCSSYNNDLAPSYMNKKENIQIFFFDLESDEMKAESKEYKYSLMKLDEVQDVIFVNGELPAYMRSFIDDKLNGENKE